jgi:hypothetical protein
MNVDSYRGRTREDVPAMERRTRATSLARDNQNSILIVALTHPQKSACIPVAPGQPSMRSDQDPLHIVARLSSRLWRYSRRFPER